ncbi:MAG: sugar ABC transporter permease [Paenibacillaceae bacterium]|nr:sugar ABC transporter permease [Paenibacillaceae bacterium]
MGITMGLLAYAKRTAQLLRRDKYLLLALLPCLLFKLVFNYIPMAGIVLAFRKFSYAHPIFGTEWVGLHYFKLFFRSPDAWPVIRNTLLINVYGLLFGFFAPVALALLFNEVRVKWFRKLAQTASYIPHFVSVVVLVGMMKLFLSPSSGMVNKVIAAFGGTPIYFFTEPEWFRTLFVASGIWQGVGWGSIIYLAAIAGIDAELYESSYMDGANRFRQMWHITLPGIRPVVILLLIYNIGGLLGSSTDKVLLMYNPLTYSTGDVLGTYLYRVGLLGDNFSLGVAIGLFNAVVGLLLLSIANWFGKRFANVGVM